MYTECRRKIRIPAVAGLFGKLVLRKMGKMRNKKPKSRIRLVDLS